MNQMTAVESLKRTYPKAELATHSVDVACSPQAFYSVITDYESYPEFVPSQVGATIVDASRSAHHDEFSVSMCLSLLKKQVNYQLAAEGTPGHSLTWRLKSGDFMRENAGGWQLETLPNGHTRATLYMAVILKGWLPKTVINALITKTCPTTVQAFKLEAERRALM